LNTKTVYILFAFKYIAKIKLVLITFRVNLYTYKGLIVLFSFIVLILTLTIYQIVRFIIFQNLIVFYAIHNSLTQIFLQVISFILINNFYCIYNPFIEFDTKINLYKNPK